MFETEVEEWANEMYPCDGQAQRYLIEGAEFGYNKANEWHYVKDGLPKESGKYLVCVGGVNGVFVLDFETEYNDFGYWCLEVASDSLGVTDTVFETITERNEDKVIAWKEIPTFDVVSK